MATKEQTFKAALLKTNGALLSADIMQTNRMALWNTATFIKAFLRQEPTTASMTEQAYRTTFTYRKVDALRYRSTLTQAWNNNSKSTVSLIYRENSIGQNPNYRIKDDYRKSGNTWIGKKDLAHGEINESSFNSYAFVAQHKQNLEWKQASVTGGVSIDLSPSSYNADYIRIKKDTITKKYVSYMETDSVLTNYQTRINNYAAFASMEISPVRKLRIVASLRYDHFNYDFDNHLKPSAFSGSPDTVTKFSRVSPKLGFTYNINSRAGFYGNYSQGFVPPQVTEMFTGVKVPNLDPSVFYNYEAGGWAELIKNKLSIDASAYKLIGANEIISVKLDDGSSENRNAGKTSHNGIEFGMNATPVKDVSLRISGAYSEHKFVQFVEKGINYNGNQMNGAPNWMHNAEIWYKPSFIKGLRLGAEWQKIGAYFMDAKNTMKYDGYNLFNVRSGYQYKSFEVWVNVMNVTDNYFSYNSSKTTSGHSYQLAEPRSFTAGISYNLGDLLKK
jgi:iron complex outermembrane receptor protein